MSLDWLEPVSPVVPARQHMSWTYLDMPESSMCAGTGNHWYQLLALDLDSSTPWHQLFWTFSFCSASHILHANSHNYSDAHYHSWVFKCTTP